MRKLVASPCRVLPFVGVLILGAALFTLAQSASQQPAQNQQSADSQNPSETLKVNVNVVQLFFNVKDKHGAHKLGWWSRRKVQTAAMGLKPPPVAEKEPLPPGSVEVMVFTP